MFGVWRLVFWEFIVTVTGAVNLQVSSAERVLFVSELATLSILYQTRQISGLVRLDYKPPRQQGDWYSRSGILQGCFLMHICHCNNY